MSWTTTSCLFSSFLLIPHFPAILQPGCYLQVINSTTFSLFMTPLVSNLPNLSSKVNHSDHMIDCLIAYIVSSLGPLSFCHFPFIKPWLNPTWLEKNTQTCSLFSLKVHDHCIQVGLCMLPDDQTISLVISFSHFPKWLLHTFSFLCTHSVPLLPSSVSLMNLLCILLSKRKKQEENFLCAATITLHFLHVLEGVRGPPSCCCWIIVLLCKNNPSAYVVDLDSTPSHLLYHSH